MKIGVAQTFAAAVSKPKIHQQLPLTPRDSQLLLSLLKTSFKQHLDQRHPAALSRNEGYVNRHLRSVLTDPLLDGKPRTSSVSLNESRSIGQCLAQLQNHPAKPMDTFREQVSQGTANLLRAKLSLRDQYKACMASPAATRRKAMQTSGAASIILQWLWSSGMEDTGIFLSDRRFTALLVPFLIAEGQQSRVSRWLHRCREQPQPFSSLQKSNTHDVQRSLFMTLIQQDIYIWDGLESAINNFLQTIADLRSFGFADKAISRIAQRPAWILTMTMLRPSKPTMPEPFIINAFSKMLREIQCARHLQGIVSVYLQKPPDPQPVLNFFRITLANEKKITSIQRLPTVRLGLRAVELFLQDDCQMEALWIMEFLQTNFAEELVSPSSTQVPAFSEYMHNGELRNLNLLDTLKVPRDAFFPKRGHKPAGLCGSWPE